jgi:Protein of unknown function (DUF3298)
MVGRALSIALVAMLSIAAAPRLVTHMQSFHAKRVFGSASSGGSAEVTLKYPEIVSAPSSAARRSLTREISAFVLNDYFGASEKAAASPQALAADFFNAYADFYRTSVKLHNFAQPYFLVRNVRVLATGPHVISLWMDEGADIGGAHPQSYTRFSNVDAQSGRVLSIDDLIVRTGRARFNRIAERYFRKARGIPMDQSFTKQGDFFSYQHGAFALPKTIGVGADGLHLYYNTYEVASYADGPTEFTIPYAALAGVVRSSLP